MGPEKDRVRRQASVPHTPQRVKRTTEQKAGAPARERATRAERAAIAVSGGIDQTVRVWDLEKAGPLGERARQQR
jgi:hypothetical protein